MNELQNHATEAVVTKLATGAQYSGAGGALIFGLTPSEWSVLGVMVGSFVAIAGFGVNWYYREQHLRLARGRATWADAKED